MVFGYQKKMINGSREHALRHDYALRQVQLCGFRMIEENVKF